MKKIITLLLLLCSVMTVSAQKYVYVKHYSENWKENTLTASQFNNKLDSVRFIVRYRDFGQLVTGEPTKLGDHSFSFSGQVYRLSCVPKGIEIGVCYSSVNKKPTINDSSKVIDTGYHYILPTDKWDVTIENLDSAKLYYYSLYAIVGDSVFYGNVEKALTGTPPLEAVDLGLSVKWASANVGAMRPEDYGYFFAWGETKPKTEFSLANYKYYDAATDSITKYNAADGLVTLSPDDDAATANFGEDWRMPTFDETKELINNCTWKEATLNGVDGYTVTGPNGNSIFLPYSGVHIDKGSYNTGYSFDIWTSTLYPKQNNPFHLFVVFDNTGKGEIHVGATIGQRTRYYGRVVRAVTTK